MQLPSLLPILSRGFWAGHAKSKAMPVMPVLTTVSMPSPRPDPKPKRQWLYEWQPGFVMCVIAHTKSEARAELKRRLKLKRLPVGAVVTQYSTGATLRTVG